MIDGSVLQSAQKCFEKKSRVVVKMVVRSRAVFFQICVAEGVSLQCSYENTNYVNVSETLINISISLNQSGEETASF